MKRSYKVNTGNKTIVREYSYIPMRYIVAMAITILEVILVISTVFLLCYFVPYFYIAAWLTEIFCVIKIISSDDNPDYKVPWLLFVLILPIVGFMLYFLFYSRKLEKRFIKRLSENKKYNYKFDSEENIKALASISEGYSSYAKMLCNISGSTLFRNTKIKYFPLGEDMHADILKDLEGAKDFIFMEYFIIEEGEFWSSILEILKRKAADGILVRVIYDDIGCMSTLPGNYYKQLKKHGIDATPFSRLRGNADGEFNNRNHRKITVIDGKIGYTGGINLADEYINLRARFGHWKDTAIRLEGEAVWELTKLFLCDFGMSKKRLPCDTLEYYPRCENIKDEGFLIPFGDGPKPLYERRIAKTAIINLISSATKYVYITTPYLIIDNEISSSIENAALRGVDVRLILPHIPDKKLVFGITRSFYHRLIASGVKIYEYTPGFIHAKCYVADGEAAIIGTVNLDYRSLVHHFECGVFLYKAPVIKDIKKDIDETLEISELICEEKIKANIFQRFIRSVARIFAPML